MDYGSYQSKAAAEAVSKLHFVPSMVASVMPKKTGVGIVLFFATLVNILYYGFCEF
jgi:hypothetical protein